MKNTLSGYLIIGIFSVVSLLTGIYSFYAWQQRIRLMQFGIKTIGTVIALKSSEDEHSANVALAVKFVTTTGGLKAYKSNFYSNNPPFSLGEKVVLWYNPAAPDEVILEKNGMMEIETTAMISFGFGGIAVVSLIIVIRKRKLIKWLKLHGRQVRATFIKFGSHRGSYRAFCEWTNPRTGERLTFKSDSVARVPVLMPGDYLSVWINPDEPEDKYWVDTSWW